MGNGCCAGDDAQKDMGLKMDAKQDSLSKSHSNSMENYKYDIEYGQDITINNMETQLKDRESSEESLILWGYLYPKSQQMNKRNTIELYENEVFFGRDNKRCDIIFSEAYISGVHALISRNINYGLDIDSSSHFGIIYDLSTNGTFINGRKIGKHIPSLIFDGDEIQFFRGDLTFIFRSPY